MKAKYIILLAISAVVTLSFTVTTSKTTIAKTPSRVEEAKVGGLASEDPIR